VDWIRACVVAISEEDANLISAGVKVRKIGWGTWSPIREHCRKVGANWDGIDVNRTYFAQPCIATRFEFVEYFLFPDETFDLVIGNKTLEHWTSSAAGPKSAFGSASACARSVGRYSTMCQSTSMARACL
jgi:hypothetical protein